MRRNRAWEVLALALLAVVVTGCGGEATAGSSENDGPDATKLRLGYFPNVTHAVAIAGVEESIFEAAVSPSKLEVKTFNAGPAAIEALLSGALDAAYIGPNPAINAFAKSKGEAIRIIAGATSGGAALVVNDDIADADDLRGKKLASPQLGGTQDVALRHWLQGQALSTDVNGGGDVSILPQENAQTLETFKSAAIDGAWVPEPWASRLVLEGGGRVLVDERDLWPEGQFVTTHLIVATPFLEKHPDVVRRLLDGHVEATELVNADEAKAQAVVNEGIERITGKALSDEVIGEAWKSLTFTNDPIGASLKVSAEHAESVGLLEAVDLDGIYDLSLLNEVLEDAGEDEVSEG